jgi:hypothetical protein
MNIRQIHRGRAEIEFFSRFIGLEKRMELSYKEIFAILMALEASLLKLYVPLPTEDLPDLTADAVKVCYLQLLGELEKTYDDYETDLTEKLSSISFVRTRILSSALREEREDIWGMGP